MNFARVRWIGLISYEKRKGAEPLKDIVWKMLIPSVAVLPVPEVLPLVGEGALVPLPDHAAATGEAPGVELAFVLAAVTPGLLAVSVLGVLEYGVHVNGLVRGGSSSSPSSSSSEEEEEETKMWIARRSATKSKFPNFLDQIVAGGQPAGVSLLENVVKECGEEAGIGEDVVRSGVRPAGAISYENWDPETDKVTRCVLFNYDLYLPPGFEPVPVDGEVQGFMLWTMDQVKASMAEGYGDPIKPNCYVVIVDYLLRTGQVSPDAKGYLDVLRALRSGDCQ